MYKCIHFNIKELVSPEVYKKFGETAWMFFDEAVLRDLDTIREENKAPITINNGRDLTQCGLRENTCKIMKDHTNKNQLYLSSHSMGKAFDLHDSLGRNTRLHSIVCNLINSKKLKAFKRVESLKSAPTWVHVDSFQTKNSKLEVFIA